MSDTPTTRVGAGRQAALYARAPQPSERDRTTAAAQLAACRALAAELGYAVADEATLADDAPNTTASRAGFAALLRLLATAAPARWSPTRPTGWRGRRASCGRRCSRSCAAATSRSTSPESPPATATTRRPAR